MRSGLATPYLSLYLSIMFRAEAHLDLAFQALADPSRRAMVDRLVQGPATVSELAAPLAMSLSGVMQHLAVLEAAGLVHSEKRGRVRTCMLEAEALSRAEAWLNARRRLVEARLDQLDTYLSMERNPKT